jgi:hypothetical protein
MHFVGPCRRRSRFNSILRKYPWRQRVLLDLEAKQARYNETNPEMTEPFLKLCTGYSKGTLEDCVNFLRSHNPENISDILKVEMVVDIIRKGMVDPARKFRIEEHQLPSLMDVESFDLLVEKRCEKASKPHQLSHWQY